MASKLSKIKVKGQKSVLKFIKDRSVTEVHSDDNNSDIPSKDKLNSPSATRSSNVAPGRKRKDRSPQEINNNPNKKINMGDEKRKLEQQLLEDEEGDLESLSPELA